MVDLTGGSSDETAHLVHQALKELVCDGVSSVDQHLHRGAVM